MAISLHVPETPMTCLICIQNFKILSQSILKLSLFLHSLLPSTFSVVLLPSPGCDMTGRD